MKNQAGYPGHFVLSSGRKLHTYSRFIGLSVDDGGTLTACTGQDQGHLGLTNADGRSVDEIELADGRYLSHDDLLTSEERREIADHMIHAWDKWAKLTAGGA